jgi:predicted ABC-type ATPase
MPEIIMVAGPNGAGKTTFADDYLRTIRADLSFLNADEIARSLRVPGISSAHLDLQAGRKMLQRIDAFVAERKSFAFETTLASLAYAKKIPLWQEQGYAVVLFYLRLPSVDNSIQRVRKRVAAGGHDVPELVLRKRFDKSHTYFEKFYKPVVDEWRVYDSLEDGFREMEFWIRS